MKKYLFFMILSFITAFLFETLAYIVGDGKIFDSPFWPVVLFFWYGFLYTVTFLLFRKKSLWYTAIFWAIAGPVLEILVFKRWNWIDSIVYVIMFVIPMGFYKIFLNKKKK